MALEGKVVNRRADQFGAFGMQRALGEEDVMVDVQSLKILADHHHHRINRTILDQRKPFFFRHVVQPRAELCSKFLADGNEIVARIKAGRDIADILAQRLAVTQENGTGEHVDLAARIVDVIFLDDIVAGKGQEVGQSVANHRTTAMTDMHRPGRVGRDVFDIGLLARTESRATIIGSGFDYRAKDTLPVTGRKADIDKAGAGHRNFADVGIIAQCCRNQVGKRARIGAERLCQDHSCVGRHIAVALVTRRLDSQSSEIDFTALFLDNINCFQRVLNSIIEVSKKIHVSYPRVMRSGLL
ncbi:hypothetical protein D3C80_710780 [compost metagenome]